MLTDHILSGFVKDISRQRLDLGFFAVAGIIVTFGRCLRHDIGCGGEREISVYLLRAGYSVIVF